MPTDGRTPPGMEAYSHWDVQPLPDPRNAAPGVVLRGLVRIVQAEGPMTALRAYRLYAKSFGVARVGSELRRHLENAMQKAVSTGVLNGVQELNELVVWAPGSPPVKPRTLGNRMLSEVPPSEIAAGMRQVLSEGGHVSDGELFRMTLSRYGISRLRGSTAHQMELIKQVFSI